MAWTYTGALNTDSEKVRYKCGDTDTTDQLVTDAEVTYVLTLSSDLNIAAAILLEGLAAKNSRKVNAGTGKLSVDASARMKQYLEMAKVLRGQGAENALSSCTIQVGGAVAADNEELDSDSSLVKPQFKIGQFDDETTNPSESTDDED